MFVPEQATLSDALPVDDTLDSAVEGAVREHSQAVYRIAFSMLRNHHDAEDAAQETFVRLLRYAKQNRLASVRNLRAWLGRVVWRVALDRRRAVSEVTLDEAAEADSGLRALGAGAEEMAANEQMKLLLARLIDALPRDLRDTLTLSLSEELSAPEMAAVLGIPEGSVRERLWRARQRLREKLAALLEGNKAVTNDPPRRDE
jgi:RNA polymerase sigma-70 factor, ECF subfamily